MCYMLIIVRTDNVVFIVLTLGIHRECGELSGRDPEPISDTSARPRGSAGFT